MTENTINFRNLRADEIMIRPTDTKFRGSAQLLLYKDARCDMSILDETVGPFGWSKDYKDIKGNLYCGVCINGIWKWDCGTESFSEKEKGEASDAFKRACFNWGLGRELYTAPKIRIKCPENYYYNDKMNMSFTVSDIQYEEKRIVKLVIVDRFGNVVFDWNENTATAPSTTVTVTYPNNYTTKIENPIDANGRLSKRMYATIMHAETNDKLVEVYNQYPELRGNQLFINTLTKRKNELAQAVAR